MLYYFSFARRIEHIATGTFDNGFSYLSSALQIGGRNHAIDRAFVFARIIRIANRNTDQITSRHVFSFDSNFETTIPYFINRIDVNECYMCICTRFLRFFMIIDGIARFNQTCRDGIDQMRRRSTPTTFNVFFNSFSRFTIFRYLIFGEFGFNIGRKRLCFLHIFSRVWNGRFLPVQLVHFRCRVSGFCLAAFMERLYRLYATDNSGGWGNPLSE